MLALARWHKDDDESFIIQILSQFMDLPSIQRLVVASGAEHISNPTYTQTT